MPISRDVRRRAAAEPDRPALVGASGTVSYGELAARAETRSEALAASGVAAGHAVVCAESEPADLLAAVLAADLLEAAAVVADADWPDAVRESAVDAARALVDRHGTAVSLVVFTSGSTGTPRPVARSRRSWTFSFPTFSALTGVGAQDTVLVPGRLSGSLFLYGALHALTVGAAVHALPSWSPIEAARACASCTAVHLVPSMLAELLDRLDPATSRLRTVVCGGAHLDPGVRAAAVEAGVEVVDYYGAAELSFVAIRRPGLPPDRLRPFPEVAVDVRDGVIWARGPYLALGLDRDPDGFATVGDHGVRHDDGTLSVHGRGDAAITTGGATVVAEAVEHVLRQVPGVAEVACVGTPHERLGQVVAAVVEPRPDRAPALAELRAAAASGLPATDRPRLWYAVDRLPRTPAGKVARAEVGAGLRDGTLGARVLT
ncbi:long-chain acyl-CoA synthetase [Actinopolymorpha cephalotaxi]|uniref:Long-chain acyl-CoA synthetase n=1 Tax=Actinopolymorpha cephalotaxi TaxID=504797 RepID=A0A1I2R0A6_9ACTN|nr:AMP-binding protein [Actinopolymorpha cephalotaxi]NYH82479.1 long-chain acyl-CoA synthetase [Actinopolymorpha cephalotaxi]SFG31967.1 long-chain acyl-CoA synthetase [Actinopolymorpha cephalotaxi]